MLLQSVAFIQNQTDTHLCLEICQTWHFITWVLTGGLNWLDDKTQRCRRMVRSAVWELHLTKTKICGMHNLISINYSQRFPDSCKKKTHCISKGEKSLLHSTAGGKVSMKLEKSSQAEGCRRGSTVIMQPLASFLLDCYLVLLGDWQSGDWPEWKETQLSHKLSNTYANDTNTQLTHKPAQHLFS